MRAHTGDAGCVGTSGSVATGWLQGEPPCLAQSSPQSPRGPITALPCEVDRRLREALGPARGGTESQGKGGVHSRLLSPKKGSFLVRDVGVPSLAEANL